MSGWIGLMIEGLVSVLLMLTIGYCIALNTRLKRLRADEKALKATIGELIAATEIAERAIAGLKLTVRDCDATLGERLRTAERFCTDIDDKLKSSGEVVEKLVKITRAGRAIEPVASPAHPSQLAARAQRLRGEAA